MKALQPSKIIFFTAIPLATVFWSCLVFNVLVYIITGADNFGGNDLRWTTLILSTIVSSIFSGISYCVWRG